MKTRVLAVAAILALAASAVAMAGTNKFSATLKKGSTPTGKLTFRIKTNDRDTATKVTSIKVSGLKTRCVDENGKIVENGPVMAGSLGSVKIKTPKQTGSAFYSFDKIKRSGNTRIGVRGLLSRRGRRVTGEVFGKIDSAAGCSALGSYKVKRK